MVASYLEINYDRVSLRFLTAVLHPQLQKLIQK